MAVIRPVGKRAAPDRTKPAVRRQGAGSTRARLHPASQTVRGRNRWGQGKAPIRYALVGLGYFAQAAVLPAFAGARNSKLVALVSDDETKLRTLGRRYKVPNRVGYGEYDDLLASGEVDAVYLALPNDMHRDFAVRAARAGVHVLCEKPMALTPEECEEMVEAARDNHVRLMVAYRLHFESANLAALEAVRKGRLGEIRYFDSVFSMDVAKGNIRTQRERGGGPLHDIGIYCVNAARYLFRAEPIDVVARSASRDDPRFREVDETVAAILTFPGDRIATFTVCFGAADLGRYTIVGTKGSLTLDNAYEFAEPMQMEVRVGERTTHRNYPTRDQVGPELSHFSTCILEGRDPEPSGKEGLIDIGILHAIQEAANTGRRIRVAGPEKARRPTRRLEARMRPKGKPRLVHAGTPHD